MIDVDDEMARQQYDSGMGNCFSRSSKDIKNWIVFSREFI